MHTEKSSIESPEGRRYLAIDLKSFYASAECVERGFDPLTTCLVVADPSRTEKTICLAVTPALKQIGIPGRPRLFEVVEQVRQFNAGRRKNAGSRGFLGSSEDIAELSRNPSLSLCYHTAPPRMAHYIKTSSKIYNIYLKYLSPDDIHAYSIDEIFADVTGYLRTYGMSAHALAMTMIRDVLQQTGITATCGIGTNLYLAKVAMDIVAKHLPADKDGVRIAELDEHSYRRLLWAHRPLTDFWRVGCGYRKKLEALGLYTMGDIARCSEGGAQDFYNEELLYRSFGVNAELLIDHAWGYEPTRISDIRSYRPAMHSLSSGQVLSRPYGLKQAKTVLLEMADALVFELLEKKLLSDQLVLSIGYDIENLQDPVRRAQYHGPIEQDRYGRAVPKSSHSSQNLGCYTVSNRRILHAAAALFDRIAEPGLLIRRMYLVANHVRRAGELPQAPAFEQLTLFTDYTAQEQARQENDKNEKKEQSLQQAMLSIKTRYGKNAVLRGLNYRDGATMIERNRQIGGHKA
ncbi:MAG: Y-family DNA polymerase [Oribacterium sp.]